MTLRADSGSMAVACLAGAQPAINSMAAKTSANADAIDLTAYHHAL
jgi:hypothetical protein